MSSDIQAIIPTAFFDPHCFYHKGFSVHRITGPYFRPVEKKILEEDIKPAYRHETVHWEQNPIYKEKPSYAQSYQMSSQTARDAAQIILSNPILSFLHNAYDFEVVDIDLWNGVEDQKDQGLPWHWDGLDGSDGTLLAYFSKEKRWDPQWGGMLEVGYRQKMTENGINEGPLSNDEVITEYHLAPNNKTFILLNNTNPFIVHRVTKLLDESRDRRVLLVSFNFKNKETPEQKSKVIF